MASPFASDSATTIPLPFDPRQSATIRKLTGLELEAAQAAHLKALIAGRPARGWSQAFRRVLEAGAATATLEAGLADPLIGFDRATIAAAGIMAWSYGEVTPARIADLDDDALEWFAREILRLTKPGLFVDGGDREVQKNDSTGSTRP